MKPIHTTREQWLNAAVELLRPEFKARTGQQVPAKVRVSCGFPFAKRKAIGQCWSPTSSADTATEIFVTPFESDPVEVLDTLTHELVHATVGNKAGHGPLFKKAANKMLLEGKMRSAGWGDEGRKTIGKPIAEKLGRYPHGALSNRDRPKKQKTNLLKCFCAHCDYTFRITQKWLDVVTPKCPDPACPGRKDLMLVNYK